MAAKFAAVWMAAVSMAAVSMAAVCMAPDCTAAGFAGGTVRAATPQGLDPDAAPATPALAGRVVDAHGEGTAAAVLLRWRVHPELPGLAGITLGDGGLGESRHATDAGGRFRIELPHRGPFLLIAETAGQRSAQRFPVMAGAFVELGLEPGREIGGIAYLPDGAPAAHVPVVLTPDTSTWARLGCYRLPQRRGRTTTDAEGRFALPWELGYLRQPQWGAFVVPWVQAPATSLPRQPLLLRPTEASRNLRIALQPERPIPIRVTTPRGNPEVGAIFRRADGVASAPTDARGQLDLPDPGIGPWILDAPGAQPLVVAAPARDGNRTTLVQQPGARLRVQLLSPGRKPIADASLLWVVPERGVPREWSSRTTADGVATFDRGIPGALLLGFVATGGTFQPFFAEVLAGHTAPRTAVLETPRRIEGQVLDQAGQPVPGARVAMFPDPCPREHPPWITYADRGGRFAFEAAGRGARWVLAEGHREQGGGLVFAGMAACRVAADGTRAALRFSAGDELRGEVRDENGELVPGAWVTAVRSRPTEPPVMPGATPTMVAPCAIADAEGRFAFEGLPAFADNQAWQILCNALLDQTWAGGGLSVTAGAADIAVSIRRL